MPGVSLIQDMVQKGRMSPSDGAKLIELRQELAACREKRQRRSRPILNAVVTLGVFLLALFGMKRAG